MKYFVRTNLEIDIDTLDTKYYTLYLLGFVQSDDMVKYYLDNQQVLPRVKYDIDYRDATEEESVIMKYMHDNVPLNSDVRDFQDKIDADILQLLRNRKIDNIVNRDSK